MNNQLIPVFAGQIQGQSIQLVDARLLHSFLEVVTRFNDWIARRVEEYGFIDGQDFYSILSKTKGRPNTEYHLSLDMAKELSMVERNEKGKQARRYFIDMERIAQTAQYGLKQLPEPKTKKALPGCLTLEQQDTIKALVKQRAEELPKKLFKNLNDRLSCNNFGLGGLAVVLDEFNRRAMAVVMSSF